MIPALESYTLALFVFGPRAGEAATEEELDALQDAHVAYLMSLVSAGKVLLCGPLTSQPDAKLRGIAVFCTDAAEANALLADDPALRAGRLEVQVMTWWVEKGRMPAFVAAQLVAPMDAGRA